MLLKGGHIHKNINIYIVKRGYCHMELKNSLSLKKKKKKKKKKTVRIQPSQHSTVRVADGPMTARCRFT